MNADKIEHLLHQQSLRPTGHDHPRFGVCDDSGGVLHRTGGGFTCYFAVTELKRALKYDDSPDVFGVHCMGSLIGMLLPGFFANAEVRPAIATTFMKNGATILLTGSAAQFFNQCTGVAFTVALAAVGTFIILKVVDRLIGLRGDQEDESAGLDLSQHGERAYNE